MSSNAKHTVSVPKASVALTRLFFHNVSNDLVAMRLHAQLLAAEHPASPEAAHIMTLSDQIGRSLAQLRRLSSPVSQITYRCSLKDVLVDFEARLQNTGIAGLAADIHIDGPLPDIHIDPEIVSTQLVEIAVPLYRATQARIQLRASAQGEGAAVVFEAPASMLSESESSDEPSSGNLELAIATAILRANGCKIAFDTEEGRSNIVIRL